VTQGSEILNFGDQEIKGGQSSRSHDTEIGDKNLCWQDISRNIC